MARIRQQKVGAQIQRIVADVLLRDVADPRVDGLISVTRVDVTPDLREAKVWLSVLGGKRTPTTVLKGIASAGRHIQHEVADQMEIRYVPRLSFHLDESLKKQASILKIIDEVNAEAPVKPVQTADVKKKKETDGKSGARRKVAADRVCWRFHVRVKDQAV